MDPGSNNSLQLILLNEAIVNSKINWAVGNKDTGMFSYDLKAFAGTLGQRRQEDWYVYKQLQAGNWYVPLTVGRYKLAMM